jgi:flagellar protein FlaG
MDRNISFEVDTLSGRDVISVFDKETQVLIRQIPSEETLELLERMDKVVGVLFNKNV